MKKKKIELKSGTVKVEQNKTDSKINYAEFEVSKINDGYVIDDVLKEFAEIMYGGEEE